MSPSAALETLRGTEIFIFTADNADVLFNFATDPHRLNKTIDDLQIIECS